MAEQKQRTWVRWLKPRKFDRSPVAIKLATLNPIADLAFRLIERWGLIAGEWDGEREVSSGTRQRARRMTPSEIVNHACDTASLAFAEFERRGWMVEMPEDTIPTDEEIEEEWSGSSRERRKATPEADDK